MIAVIVVREGQLPAGAAECVAEAGGRGIVIGTEVNSVELSGALTLVEAGPFGPAAYAALLAGRLVDEPVILPASPDGRDLAPRLAALLGWPLLAPALAIGVHSVKVVRQNGRILEEVAVDGPFVATLLPGVRGVGAADSMARGGAADSMARGSEPMVERGGEPVVARGSDAQGLGAATPIDPELIALLPPDPSTMSLVEATRIVAGGQGLGSTARFEQLGRIGAALGASVGGTRVASDAGWIPFERQIGTTGVAVNPRVYLAFGISGATQHTSGLGDPAHIIAVNTDASCPMMAMADIAIVSDAKAVLDALERQLSA